jgi:VWFA-related protein
MSKRMLGVMLAATLVSAVSAQQTPVFRGGIDLVTVDVVVLDKAGAPVPNLTAADFTVVAGGKARRIVAADYVTVTAAAAPRRSATAAAAPSASTNARIPSFRTFVIVVDVENLLSGGGRLAFKTIGDYLDKLGANDRVGLLALPNGNPSIEPTTDRAAVRDALSKLAGISMRLRLKDMTFGEATGIFNGDLSALFAYWRRVADQGAAMPFDQSCSPPKVIPDSLVRVPAMCTQEAERTLERARFQSRGLLSRLRSLADAMAVLPGPKAIILASGGTVVDQEILAEQANFATAAEKARVTVYTLFLESLPGEIGDATGPSTDTKRLDQQVGLNGLSGISGVARGATERVIGDATVAMKRIDRELSGYYLLSFEQDPADKEGARIGIDVRAKREGLTLLARKEFTASRAAAPSAGGTAAPADLKPAVADMLKSGAALTQVPLAVDSYSLPGGATGPEGRAVIAVELGLDARKAAAFGFQVANSSGKVVADGYDAPAKLQSKGEGRSIFVTQVPVATGRFVARFAVVDAQGQRGSVQHVFEVPDWTDAPVRVSDLTFGESTGADFRPASDMSRAASLTARLVIRDSSGKFDGVRATATLMSAVDDSVLGTMEVPLQNTEDKLRRFADLTLAVGQLPPGEYVISMLVSAQGRDLAKRTRLFSK